MLAGVTAPPIGICQSLIKLSTDDSAMHIAPTAIVRAFQNGFLPVFFDVST